MYGRISNVCLSVLLVSAIGTPAMQAQRPGPGNTPAPQTSATQNSQPQNSEPPNPQLQPNPYEALRRFEPPADEEYQLGRGDEIQIDFTGRPELQAKLVIGPDGRVTLPLAGELMLAGLTRSESAQRIVTALTPYYANLSVLVTVTRYTANRVLVLGAVDHPGPMIFDGTPTLLEAVTRGGLPLVGPLKRPQIPDQCAIYRGSDKVMWVQLRQLLETGNTLADIRLRRDDVVYVPDPSERFVSVMGEVTHPGPVQLNSNSTLASVLAEVGGLTEKAGAHPSIQIVDPKTGSFRKVPFKDLLNPAKSLEVTLHPGDILYVPQSGFYRATYFLERINPMASLAVLAAVNGAL